MAITEALKGGQGEEAAETAGKMTDLLKSLQPDTLQRLMEMGGDVEKRKRFVLDASQSLAAEAVLVLVEAASKASRQTISHTMLRLIGKLALQAEKGGSVMRAGASRALKEQVEQLADDWDPRRLNPESYQDALDRMAQRRVFTLMLQRQHPCEPKRLVMTSLETDTLGAPVWLAVNQLISHGGISMLLDLLDRAPANSKVAEELWPLVATPDNLRHLLREEQIDPQLLERITTRLGLDVIELLLEGLESSETRTMRRKLLDLLAKFGADAGPMVVKRLEMEDTPWYVQRNLLTLLQLLPKMPAGFQPKRYLTHNDERVRREALKLMLRLPELREQTIVAALGDRDDGIVKLAMQAALTDCPKAAIPLIRRHCERKSITSELRALGLRIVGSAKDLESQPWLLGYVVTKTRFLKREKLVVEVARDARRAHRPRRRLGRRPGDPEGARNGADTPRTSRSARRRRPGGSPMIEPIRFLNAFGKTLVGDGALRAVASGARESERARPGADPDPPADRGDGEVLLPRRRGRLPEQDAEGDARLGVVRPLHARRHPAPRVRGRGHQGGVRGLPLRGDEPGLPGLARSAPRAALAGDGVQEHPLRRDRHPRRRRPVHERSRSPSSG